MSTQIVCVYTAQASGALTGAQLATKIAAVPLDTQLLTDYGLSVTSDVTGNAGVVVTRTITLSMVPAAAALLNATLMGGSNGTGISSVAVAGAGTGYVGVPIVTPALQANIIRPAQMHAVMGAGFISSIVIDDPGDGYQTAPAINVTPLFKSLFPDGTDQVSPMQNFMTEVLEAAVLATVVASTPVVS